MRLKPFYCAFLMAFIVIGLLIANSTTVFSQPDNLLAATKSPANEWVILASGAGELFYWSPNLQSPQRLVATNGHDIPVISPSHTMISYAKAASIWVMDLDGSNPRKVAAAGERIDSIAWAPNGKRLAFIAWQTIDVNTQRTTIYTVDVTGQNFKGVATASGDALVGDIGWTPDGKEITYTVKYIKDLRITGQEIWIMNVDGSEARVFITSNSYDSGLVWSPNGKQIAFVSSRDRSVCLYIADASGKNQRRLTNAGVSVTSIIWSSNGKQLMFGARQNEVYQIDVTGKNQTQLFSLRGHPVYWGPLVLSPKVAALAPTAAPKTAMPTQTATKQPIDRASFPVITKKNAGQLQQILHIPAKDIYRVAFSLEGNPILFGGDGSVTLWDLKTSTPRLVLPKNAAIDWGEQPHAAGILLGWNRQTKTIYLWSLKTGKLRASLPTPERISALAISSDGNSVAFDDTQGGVTLWDVKSGKKQTINTEQYHLNGLVFSLDGKSLVTSGSRIIRIWDIKTGKRWPIEDIQGISEYSIALSQDGKFLATVGHPELKSVLWDTQTGKAYPTSMKTNQYLGKATFSPDGALIAFIAAGFAEPEAQIQLWDIQADKLLVALPTKDRWSVAFDRTGTLIVTHRLDGVTLWAVTGQ